MPGVADAERRTRNRQDKEQRKRDMDEILRMVKEGRLHEADDSQLETLGLALELQRAMSPEPAMLEAQTDPGILEAIKEAVKESLAGVGVSSISASPALDPSRPEMKHTSLSSLKVTEDDLKVSHLEDMGQTKEGEEDAADKLAKLRKIKGNK